MPLNQRKLVVLQLTLHPDAMEKAHPNQPIFQYFRFHFFLTEIEFLPSVVRTQLFDELLDQDVQKGKLKRDS